MKEIRPYKPIIENILANADPENRTSAYKVKNEVVYEAIHVLMKVYEIDRVTVATTLSELFEKQVIESPDTELTKKALQVFKQTKLDFVDCLLIAHQSLYQTKIKSFDKKMNRYLDAMSF